MTEYLVKVQSDLIDMDIVELDACDAKIIAQQLVGLLPWSDLDYKQEDLESYLDSIDSMLICYKLMLCDEIAGVLCVKKAWWRGIYIEMFAVFPKFQNKGLGKKAIQWVQKNAKADGLGNIWLLVSDFNYPASQFYFNQGFIEIGVLKDLLKQGCSEVLLRKQI